ncbi:MAG TPA: lipid-binding SYLF domain-containing protein [Candidatus Sulfotelmatobacter sp.]
MRSLLHLALAICVAATAFGAETATKAQARVQAAGAILQAIQAAPDHGIPEKVLASAACVAIVPSMLNGGFALGLRYGRGVATCRTAKGWSAPAFFVVEGGSFGLQFGGQAVDLIMLVMNDDGMANLLASKFKLGGQASIAAGPVGRQTGAETDWKMRAQVLTYARARGAFIGATLEHGQIKQDKDSTRAFYAHLVRPRTSLRGEIDAPSTTYPFLEPLSEWARAAAEK